MLPSPNRMLAWMLRAISSRDEASAEIGDVLDEYGELTTAGRSPRHPALWMNTRVTWSILAALRAVTPKWMRSMGLILRDAFRAIRSTPAQSAFIVFVLAAGITLGTVTFSVVDATVLKPLPLERPEQLVSISVRDQAFKQRITSDLFWRLHDELPTVEDFAGRSMTTGVMVTVAGVTDQVSITRATSDVFRMFRLTPVIGQFWTTADDAKSDADVAVLGYRFWREQLGADPAVLGKTVSIGTRIYTIIGVLSAASDHPEVDLTTTAVWTPTLIPLTRIDAPIGITARMRPGVTPVQLARDIQRIAETSDWQPKVTRLLDAYTSRFGSWMLLALGAAALVVLVACANAANLMLTRAATRMQELAIRAALGASRRHVATMVVTEGLLLSAAATTAALLLSIGGVRLARVAITSAPLGVFRASTISLNGRVLVMAIAVAVMTGVLCSLVPAWQTSRAPMSMLLKDADSRTSTVRRGWRSIFLTAEIASVVVLLVMTWLFVVSLIHVNAIDLGLDTEHLLAISPRSEFQGTVDDVQQRIAGMPGVSGVAVSTTSLPLIGRAFGGAWPTIDLRAQNSEGASGAPLQVLDYRVTPNYFAVAGLRMIQGRTLPAFADDASAVVLDQQAARQLFGDDNAVGRQILVAKPAGVFTVVGVVPHVYPRGVEEDQWPSAYFALKPNPARKFAALFVKTSRPAEDMLPVVTDALKSVGPNLKEPFVFIADDAVQRITATRRFNAQMMSVFGIVGILIGAAGVYAVMASFVAQQTREIGVRLALGATPSRIERAVLMLASRHLLVGFALGVPLAWWLSRGFSALFFRVTPADLSVYIGVGMLLAVAGYLAAWVPARRAAHVDPIVSLRR
jgi:putative ABC transport system permease protein